MGKYSIDRNQIVISPITIQCDGLITVQYMTSRTLNIRELKEELFDTLEPSHCRKSKMDAYTFKNW